MAAAGLLLAAALLLHGAPSTVLSEQMAIIAAGPLRWSAAHWLAASALSCFAAGGLIMLATDALRSESGWVLSAWAVVVLGAISTLSTGVAEATVITEAATSGSSEIFTTWWAFAEGKANGFALLALAVALLAATRARHDDFKPRWAGWVGVIAGIGSFAGWALGVWLGVAFGSPVWLASSLLMCLWTLWFGQRLTQAS